MGSSTSVQWKEPSEKCTHIPQKKITQSALMAIEVAREAAATKKEGILISPIK